MALALLTGLLFLPTAVLTKAQLETPLATMTRYPSTPLPPPPTAVPLFGQCGGTGFTGQSICATPR
ncbi:hypothetical protein CC2G_003507 [Coprinopsis cinerea AmutBmut pab1-1]|nr:hypothetical protein CC2G_003507 [Coprinopsis cinerea AmutBmut pab1-1]